MAYKTRAGRRIRIPGAATNGIQYLVKLEGTRATFECKAGGHRSTIDYSKGPVSRRMSAQALARFVKYWSKPTGHLYGWCQRCQNIADGVEDKS